MHLDGQHNDFIYIMFFFIHFYFSKMKGDLCFGVFVYCEGCVHTFSDWLVRLFLTYR